MADEMDFEPACTGEQYAETISLISKRFSR